MEDEWDAFDAPSSEAGSAPQHALDAAVDEARAAKLAEEYVHLETLMETTRSRMELISEELARLFPEVEGTMNRNAGGYTITMKRPERWVWDKEMLEAMFGDGELPPYVRRNFSVDKRKFQSLKASEQDALKPALTRKLGNPKIEVTPNV
jgi:DNA-binding transcriptional MocR family regulator